MDIRCIIGSVYAALFDFKKRNLVLATSIKLVYPNLRMFKK